MDGGGIVYAPVGSESVLHCCVSGCLDFVCLGIFLYVCMMYACLSVYLCVCMSCVLAVFLPG